MTLPSLTQKSDENLLKDLKTLRGKECTTVADIVLHLSEVDKRQIYREIGYSSLFTYCTTCLEYSESSAHRRIQAARALDDNPEIYELLKTGKLSLCAVGELRKVMDVETKTQLIAESKGKSRKEVEKLVVKAAGPIEKHKKERVKLHKVEVAGSLFSQEAAPKVEESYSVSMELSKEDMALYEEVKNLIGPCTMAEVFRRTMKEYLRTRNTVSRITSAPEVSSKTVDEKSRYIRKATKVLVRARDGGRCTYEKDGKRCNERCGLQFDHIHPHAVEGANSAENLRLLCPAQNRLYAEKTFGRDFIKSQIRS